MDYDRCWACTLLIVSCPHHLRFMLPLSLLFTLRLLDRVASPVVIDLCSPCKLADLKQYKELPSSDLRFGTHPDGRSILVMLYDVRDERKLRKKIALLARNSEPHSIWAEAVVTARPWTQELTVSWEYTKPGLCMAR